MGRKSSWKEAVFSVCSINCGIVISLHFLAHAVERLNKKFVLFGSADRDAQTMRQTRCAQGPDNDTSAQQSFKEALRLSAIGEHQHDKICRGWRNLQAHFG